MKISSSLIKSRASKAKNHKWAKSQRFGTGHDPASLSLLPEQSLAAMKARQGKKSDGIIPPNVQVGVWRSGSFKQSPTERIYESAQRLIKAGRVSSVDEAVERATKALQTSWGTQLGTETVVELK